MLEARLGYNYLVGASVLIQNRLLSEILSALAALVRFLSGVDAQVLQ